MSSLTPTLGGLTLEAGGQSRQYAEGVKVNFKGRALSLSQGPGEAAGQEAGGSGGVGQALGGYFICAFHVFRVAQELARRIAVKMGLGPGLADTREGVENVIGEFLNVIIGLTSSDWAKKGLEILFDPPEKLGGHLIDPIPTGSEAYHLAINLMDGQEISIFLNFLF
jgi:CheY-specific phosphatase CheX